MQSHDKELLTRVQGELWIKPEALIDLFYDLRHQGFKLGVQQYLDWEQILIELTARRQFPKSTSELGAWLAPIVCTSPEEQLQFHQHLENWLKLRTDVVLPFEPKDLPAETETKRAPTTFARPVLASLSWRHAVIVAVVAATLTALYLIPKRQARPEDTNDNRQPSPAVSPTPPLPSPTTPTETLQPTPAETNPTIGIISGPTKTITDSSNQSWVLPSVGSVFVLRYFKSLYLGIAALPLVALSLWWIWSFYQRRLQLERLKSKQKPRLDKIVVRGVREKVFKNQTLRRIARELRRHRRSGSSYLDVSNTVNATIGKAGLFTPVYSLRRSSPEYLVLIDRAGFGDQQASFYDELIGAFKSNDIYIDKYYFHRDPRFCRTTDLKAHQITLEDLSAKHPEHHLILFTDGAGFINSLTGRPQSWLGAFSTWSQRALLTAKPFLEWSYSELSLSQLDFLVLPASNDGLNALVDAISTTASAKILDDHSLPFPKLLRERPTLWLDRHAPPESIVIQLSRQLRRYLEEDGYYLLGACAVYPMLQWDITLYLGYELIPRTELERTLLALVRLPWFRHGTMPDWLRTRLITEMPRQQEQRVREKLELLLAGVITSSQGGFHLPIAAPVAQEMGGWQRTREWLSKRFARRRQRAVLKHFVRAENADSLAQDYVFLNFISGSRLALAVPAALQRALKRRKFPLPWFTSLLTTRSVLAVGRFFSSLFFRRGLSILGFRFASLLAIAILAAVTVGMAAALSLPDGSTPASASLPSLLSLVSTPIPVPTPTPEYKFTPTSSERGKDATLVISPLAECEIANLKDTSLRIVNANGVSLHSLTTDECQLKAQLSIPAQTPVGDLQMELVRGDVVLGNFNYTVTVPCTTAVTIDCPAVVTGPEIVLHANVKDLPQGQNLKYQWEVPDGIIVSGQGTASIKVRFPFPVANQVVSVSSGLIRRVSWQQRATPTATPLATPTPRKLPRIPRTRALAVPRAIPAQPSQQTVTDDNDGDAIATVKVSGLPNGCANTASCEFALVSGLPAAQWPPVNTLPFANIARIRQIDQVCTPDGSGNSEGMLAQNRVKNNFSATGEPVPLNFGSFDMLQKQVEVINFPQGTGNLPGNRSQLKNMFDLGGVSRLGEGRLVTLVAYIGDAHYGNVAYGESVNCKLKGEENNDIELILAESPGDGPCQTIVAEISPHFRPDAWAPAPLKGVGRPVRITGQLFYDSIHMPCSGGEPARFARRSVWEIHPVYNIEVCKANSIAACDARINSMWIPLEDFLK